MEWIQSLPLPWFALIGAFIEELTPIPASVVMAPLGSFLAARGQSILMILILSLIAAGGKEIAYYLLYILGDKAEDLVLKKFGKFFGIKHSHVESIGKHLNKGLRDDFLVFILRAMPIIPTMLISLVCGIVRINFRTYMVSSFLGTLVRNLIYLYLGFSGVQIFNAADSKQLQSFPIWTWITLGIIVLIGILMMVFRKKIKSKLGIK